MKEFLNTTYRFMKWAFIVRISFHEGTEIMVDYGATGFSGFVGIVWMLALGALLYCWIFIETKESKLFE